jgi:hypothetical protein
MDCPAPRSYVGAGCRREWPAGRAAITGGAGMGAGSRVGLDVHARSVVAGVIDAGSGEVRSLRVPPGNDGTVAWLRTLPTPVRVVYETGPTGYGVALRMRGRGSVAWWRRRRGSGRPLIGSRPIGVMPSGWRGCCGWVRSRRCVCGRRRRRPRVISCARVDGRARRLESVRPRSLGPFLALTPSERSSGERRRQGAITRLATLTCVVSWSRPLGTNAGHRA